MELGISGSAIGPNATPHRVAEDAQAAESHGFSMFGYGDTQSILRESYSCLSVVAQQTSTIELGPMITNPITRHPILTASALCTLDEISGGRAFVGAGTGDSAVFTIGKQPAKLRELHKFVDLIKAVSQGESFEYDGETLRLNWVDEDEPHDIPVLIAADGPQTQRLAGMVADRVMFSTGLTPEVIEKQVEQINTGARRADRDPSSIEKWVVARCNVGDDREAAVDELKSHLASGAHHSLRSTFENKHVPSEYEDDLRELVEEYQSHDHVEPGESPNSELVERLGLTDYLAERYGIIGDEEYCLERFEEIRDTGHVDGVYCLTPTDRTREVLTRLGDAVIPHL